MGHSARADGRRALYDKVGKFHPGFIHYSYRRGASETIPVTGAV